MDFLAVTAKIAGALLFVWTSHSIFRHFARTDIKTLFFRGTATVQKHQPSPPVKSSSIVEHFLNHLLLYLWFVFLLSFSLGMIFNN